MIDADPLDAETTRLQSLLLDAIGGAVMAQAIIGISTDITGRKKTGQTVRHLSAIVESSSDAIISTTPDGMIHTWNNGAERLYGCAAHEVIGRDIRILARDAAREDMTALMLSVASGELMQGLEAVRRHKGGSLVDVSLAISTVLDEDGSLLWWTTSVLFADVVRASGGEVGQEMRRGQTPL